MSPSNSDPRRRIMAMALASLIVLASAGLAGCGNDEEEVDRILDRAFSQSVGSAQVAFNLDMDLQGLQEASEPFRVQLEGPYRSGAEEELPAFDFDVSVGGGTLPTPTQALGVISTGNNLFLEFGGNAYEAGEDVVAKQVAARKGTAEEDEEGLGALGVDPRTWVEEGQLEGDEEIGGVETTHVSGTVSVPELLLDLNQAAERAASLGDQAPPVLSEAQRAQIEEIVEDPQFDLYAGKEDGKIRRVSVSVPFTVPEEDRASLGGLSSGSVGFDMTLTNVGEEVAIEAPPDARPLRDLAKQLQGLAGLGLQGGGLGAPPGGADQGDQGAAPAPPGLPEDGGAPSGGAPAPDAFQEYGDCVKQADPGDADALAACAELLGG